jgi:twitching motility protein PilU
MIRRGDVHEIKAVLEKTGNLGMQTLDKALYRLVESGRISMNVALKNADSPNNLRLNLSLGNGKPDAKNPPASA